MDFTSNDRRMDLYHQVRDALQRAHGELVGRMRGGRWEGRLSSSALSTATALSAFASYLKFGSQADPRRATIRAQIERGLEYLVQQANDDGGFGDTDKSKSNNSTTMLAIAALRMTGATRQHSEIVARAEQFIADNGSIDGIRARYGRDKTFAVPILANAAMAGMVEWREVAGLPFEAACLPQSWYRFARLPVVSYAIPALVAIGQVKYHFDPPRNPVLRWIRACSRERSLHVLARMQPESGGYLEAIPLTSFVVMALAQIGRAAHAVTMRGVDFLMHSQRDDGSWPIDTNLATWVTSLAISSVAAASEFVDERPEFDLGWLMHCQNQVRHPFTGASPGGWGWSDLSGAVPDADDTPGALLAIKAVEAMRRMITSRQEGAGSGTKDGQGRSQGDLTSKEWHVGNVPHEEGMRPMIPSSQEGRGEARSDLKKGAWQVGNLPYGNADVQREKGNEQWQEKGARQVGNPPYGNADVQREKGNEEWRKEGAWQVGNLPYGNADVRREKGNEECQVKVVRQVGNVHDNKWQVRNVLDEVGKAPREIQDLVREDGNVGHVKMGLRWLLNLQNRDGGWPTFCRGWGTLPFDRSGSDLTAHALRAIHAWRGLNVAGARSAMSRGVRYLQSQQQRDGSWLPLWFGNQDKPGDENPVYGTCKVLCAYRDLEQLHSQPAQRGAGWLLENQNPDGGWGGGKSVCWPLEELGQSSVEETALAVEVMAEFAEDEKFAAAFERGARWLVLAVRNGFHTVPTPIGFYFAKLWYYEDAYPLVFAVSALGRVARRLCGGATSAADAVGRVTLK